MATPNQTILFRHAESTANVNPRLWGSPNSAVTLTPLGISQVNRLSRHLVRYLADNTTFLRQPRRIRVLSSPILRSRQTAELLLDRVRAHYPEFSVPSYIRSDQAATVASYRRYAVFDKLREFYSWDHPTEDLSSWDFQTFMECPDMKEQSYRNIRSWNTMVRDLGSLSSFLCSTGSPNLPLVMAFTHHFAMNTLIFHWLRSVDQSIELRNQFAALAEKHPRLSYWFALRGGDLSQACHRLQIPHACGVVLGESLSLSEGVHEDLLKSLSNPNGDATSLLGSYSGEILTIWDLLIINSEVARRARLEPVNPRYHAALL